MRSNEIWQNDSKSIIKGKKGSRKSDTFVNVWVSDLIGQSEQWQYREGLKEYLKTIKCGGSRERKQVLLVQWTDRQERKMWTDKDKIVDVGRTEFRGLVVGMENENCSETFRWVTRIANLGCE